MEISEIYTRELFFVSLYFVSCDQRVLAYRHSHEEQVQSRAIFFYDINLYDRTQMIRYTSITEQSQIE